MFCGILPAVTWHPLLLEVISRACVYDGDCDRWICTKRVAAPKESEKPPVGNTNMLLLFQVETRKLLLNDEKNWWTSSKTVHSLSLVSTSPIDWVVIAVSFGQPLFQQFTTNTFKPCVLCCYYCWALMQWRNGQMCKHVYDNSVAPHGQSVQKTR